MTPSRPLIPNVVKDNEIESKGIELKPLTMKITLRRNGIDKEIEVSPTDTVLNLKRNLADAGLFASIDWEWEDEEIAIYFKGRECQQDYAKLWSIGIRGGSVVDVADVYVPRAASR